MDAEHRAKRRLQDNKTVDFGVEVPFVAIPQLVEQEFQDLEKAFCKATRAFVSTTRQLVSVLQGA
jgi:hypothetical protein